MRRGALDGPRMRRGFTLVELVVATGLASVLLVALFRLLDVTLDLWSKGETRRALVERASATGELLATDLRALHNGAQGDLLAEWVPFDADGDGRVDRVWPRVRLVRQASVEDLVRIDAEDVDPALLAKAAELGVDPASLVPPDERRPPPVESGLVQIVWAVLPASATRDGRAEGVLMRGEEVLAPGDLGQFFEPTFFASTGQPRAGALREVTGGVLWVGLLFATQTTVVWDGWNLGGELADAAASWDAWNRRRPDPEVHFWNEPGAGMPAVEGKPLLPRRVRVELEFETAAERERRTRLAFGVDALESRIDVEDQEGLPRGRAAHVLVGSEWMEIVSVDSTRATVRRGARGTAAVAHDPGEMVHWAEPVVLEVPIVTHDDDWNLSGRGRR